MAQAWYVDELGEPGKGREEDRIGERGRGRIGGVGGCVCSWEGREGIQREQPGSSVWQ